MKYRLMYLPIGSENFKSGPPGQSSMTRVMLTLFTGNISNRTVTSGHIYHGLSVAEVECLSVNLAILKH
jgi:hypothetical protein